jgi:hypothetical protein
MRNRIFALAAASLGLLASATAEAGEQVLVTAPINSTFADSDTLFCQAVNVGKKPIEITFQSHAVMGNVVGLKGPVTLDPGEVDGLQELASAQYCKFLVTGSRKGVRAHAVYYDSANMRYLLSIPAQ